MHYRGRALVVCLFPGWLEIREKGRRHAYSVDYLSIHSLGAKKQAERAREERKAARKNRRKKGTL